MSKIKEELMNNSLYKVKKYLEEIVKYLKKKENQIQKVISKINLIKDNQYQDLYKEDLAKSPIKYTSKTDNLTIKRPFISNWFEFLYTAVQNFPTIDRFFKIKEELHFGDIDEQRKRFLNLQSIILRGVIDCLVDWEYIEKKWITKWEKKDQNMI